MGTLENAYGVKVEARDDTSLIQHVRFAYERYNVNDRPSLHVGEPKPMAWNKKRCESPEGTCCYPQSLTNHSQSYRERVNANDDSNQPPSVGDPRFWRKKNAYYYTWINKIYASIIPPNSRVLHIGCECGDLLAEMKPSHGVGVDTREENIRHGTVRYPHLRFVNQDPHALAFEEAFDYVIISNSLGQWRDVQKVFQNIQKVTHAETRIVITYYNYLWEGILRLGSRCKFRRPLPYQNWLPTVDIANLLHLCDFDIIRTASYVTFPVPLPLLASFCNYVLSMLPGFRRLNLITLLVARPQPVKRHKNNVSVSVVIPCRNERGNIADAIQRIPSMGKETEIIFVDGNSTDGTALEIEQQIKQHPERSIRLIHQGTGVGKGDAVRKGFAQALGDVLVIQDADLTAPPEDLTKFFDAWCDGKGDFINGSRLVYPLEKQSMRFLNYLGNKFFGGLFSWLLDQRFCDTLCGTKMISRKHYERIEANRHFLGDLDPFGDFDLIFGSVKLNLKLVEVPIRYQARTYGKTNISRFRHGLLLLKMSWLAFKRIKCIQSYPHHDTIPEKAPINKAAFVPVSQNAVDITTIPVDKQRGSQKEPHLVH